MCIATTVSLYLSTVTLAEGTMKVYGLPEACRINLHVVNNSDSRMLLANDTKICAFRAHFRSGHYKAYGPVYGPV